MFLVRKASLFTIKIIQKFDFSYKSALRLRAENRKRSVTIMSHKANFVE